MTARPHAGTAGPGALVAPPGRDRCVRRPVPALLTPSPVLGLLMRCGVRPARLPRRTELGWWLGVSAVLAGVAWLDGAASPLGLHGAPELRTAAAFGVVWTGLQILSSWIATAAEITATYLWVALQWLSSVTAGFLRSTGAMFSRVWDGMRIVWSDVLKPALVWLDGHLKRAYDWMRSTFRPVFDFLRDVRERIRAFYNTFVRPVTDTIEFIRAVNRTLLVFHIDVLQKLDRTLQQVEQRIDEPFIWIDQKLNEITNWLNRIVTANGLFQRLTLVKSLAHYAPSWIAGFYNSQIDTKLIALKTKAIDDVPIVFDPAKPGDDLARFYRGESSDLEADVDDCLTLWREAAGVTAPAP